MLVTVRPRKQHHYKRTTSRYLAALLAILIVIGIINYARPLPSAATSLQVPTLPAAQDPTINWPTYGQAAIAANGFGLLGSHGNQTPIPTASIAKVITALCVLQKYPLKVGQAGPKMTISAQDVGIYNTYVSENGSRTEVQLGEQLTEYQSLQAMLIPSANNIADSLAIWAFGSQDTYATYANQFLVVNGLVHSHVGSDASGFDPSTISTAEDLAQLGLLAAKNPVIMDIAGQTSATLPVAGTVTNYDTILGIDGITGLKTGNSDQNPGAFLFTSQTTIGGKQITLAGAIMNGSSLGQALNSTLPLVRSFQQAFEQVTPVTAGQTIGSIHAPWGATTAITAQKSLQIVRWKGEQLHSHSSLHPTSGQVATSLGALEVSTNNTEASTPVIIKKPLPRPSFWWRLTRH